MVDKGGSGDRVPASPARPSGLDAIIAKHRRRRKLRTVAAVAMVVAVMCGIGFLVTQGGDTPSADNKPSAEDSAAADDLDAYLSDNFSSLPWYSTYSGADVSGATASVAISDASYASQVCSAVSGWAFSNLNDWSIDSVVIVDPSGSRLLSRSGVGDSC